MMRYTITQNIRNTLGQVQNVQFEVVLDLHALAATYAQKAYDSKGQRVREAHGAVILSVLR